MRRPRDENQRWLIRLWLPTLAFGSFIAVLVVAAFLSGDPERVAPVAIALPVAAAMVFFVRWRTKRRLERMYQSPDPTQHIRWMESAIRKSRYLNPHGSHAIAGNSATVLALYGRFDEAERALDSVSWDDVPPLIVAQALAARAVIAYARGDVTDGLDHAAAATINSAVDSAMPGAHTSELAFRTYRNLGLALAGRATDTTREELTTALTKLPPLGQILAAWGLAAIAKQHGDTEQLASMRSLIATRAPHFAPVLASIA